MHIINLSEPAGFDLWKNSADQTSFVFMEYNEESMQMISGDCMQICDSVHLPSPKAHRRIWQQRDTACVCSRCL